MGFEKPNISAEGVKRRFTSLHAVSTECLWRSFLIIVIFRTRALAGWKRSSLHSHEQISLAYPMRREFNPLPRMQVYLMDLDLSAAKEAIPFEYNMYKGREVQDQLPFSGKYG